MGRLKSQSSELLSGSAGAELSLGPCRTELETHLEVSDILRLIIVFAHAKKSQPHITHLLLHKHSQVLFQCMASEVETNLLTGKGSRRERSGWTERSRFTTTTYHLRSGP